MAADRQHVFDEAAAQWGRMFVDLRGCGSEMDEAETDLFWSLHGGLMKYLGIEKEKIDG